MAFGSHQRFVVVVGFCSIEIGALVFVSFLFCLSRKVGNIVDFNERIFKKENNGDKVY